MSETKTKKTTLLRPPVVTIMGHVDHGKTTLLDALRNSAVAEKEHGGITQHIGAYQMDYKGQKITFIDTPGHAAFSEMRARGANVTDIVILVVAADDGVMPQTKESLAHIKSAGTPFIVAANKMDAPGADLNKLKQQLAESNVLVEDYGGDVVLVPISAKNKQGLDELLEMIILVCEIQEFKDTSKEEFSGVVIEAALDRFRGPVATVLVKSGSISVGETVTTGNVKGKIRALKDSEGKMVQIATVSMPIELMGLEKVPSVGDIVTKITKATPQVESEPLTKQSPKFSFGEPEKKEFRLVIKADVGGSLEAISRSVMQLETPESKVKVILQETGDITESDVYLANATKSLILGFNVKPLPSAAKLAEREKVFIKIYNIIYELLDDLKEGIDSLTVKEEELKVRGKAKVLALFETSSGLVTGCKVLEGEVARGDTIKLFRDDKEMAKTKVVSLKHLKEEIAKAEKDQEFGMITKPSLDLIEGDIISSYYGS